MFRKKQQLLLESHAEMVHIVRIGKVTGINVEVRGHATLARHFPTGDLSIVLPMGLSVMAR